MSGKARTDSKTLSEAMGQIAILLQTEDGIANAAIAEAANRITELERELAKANARLDEINREENKMTELFDNLPESKSPRLLWMERHGVKVSGPDIDDEILAVAKDKRGIERTGYGQDEQSAIADLARKCGWKLWNEEGATE